MFGIKNFFVPGGMIQVDGFRGGSGTVYDVHVELRFGVKAVDHYFNQATNSIVRLRGVKSVHFRWDGEHPEIRVIMKTVLGVPLPQPAEKIVELIKEAVQNSRNRYDQDREAEQTALLRQSKSEFPTLFANA